MKLRSKINVLGHDLKININGNTIRIDFPVGMTRQSRSNLESLFFGPAQLSVQRFTKMAVGINNTVYVHTSFKKNDPDMAANFFEKVLQKEPNNKSVGSLIDTYKSHVSAITTAHRQQRQQASFRDHARFRRMSEHRIVKPKGFSLFSIGKPSRKKLAPIQENEAEQSSSPSTP